MAKKTLGDLDYSILQQCMHCGMCLPSCPTYDETKKERHSPRGRIALMRAVADKELDIGKAFAEEMYYCLGCLACTSACPAGVDYATLFETARSDIEDKGILRNPKRNLTRYLMLKWLFTRPRLLRMVGRILWLWQASGAQRLSRRWQLVNMLPGKLRRLEPQTPVIKRQFSHQLIQPVEFPEVGKSRYKVAMLTGCVQDLVFSDINRASVNVLKRNGCEVHTPPVQSCCGSLHAHNGDRDSAIKLAKRAIDQIDPLAYDAIISNAGGCGSHLRGYGDLLQDDPVYAERAKEWSRKLKDIHEYLVEINYQPPNPSQKTEHCKVTYHDSCHLCHGQKVSRQPRQILQTIPGVQLSECGESTWCCGSAGIYNITHPQTSAQLLDRKLQNIAKTDVQQIATANPGCHLQIENGIKSGDFVTKGTTVIHPVVLLDRAYQNEDKF